MRAGRPSGNIMTKIELEMLVAFEPILMHVDDVDLVVAFGLDNTAWDEVFDQEVIRDHEPFLVPREPQIMRPRVRTEVQHIQDLRMVRTRDVEHHHFPGESGVVERDK